MQAGAVKSLNEGLIDLDDQWSNNLQVVNQLDKVPTGDYDPSVVLCTLEGILSDFSEETRNDRWYTEELWSNVINSPDFEELVRTKTLFGESDHPMDIEDRYDVHYNYVSHCCRDIVLDRDKKCVRGKVDILDTPAGRIIFTFVKYGSTLGVSSRGAGDLIERNGRIEVDPRTYQFYAWDIVHRPSNRKARVTRIHESINPNSRLLDLVESAKSNKSSLRWIKSLVESTGVPDKVPVLSKINEYVDMLQGDDSDPPLTGSERENYEVKISRLQADIVELTNRLTTLNANLEPITKSNLEGSIDSSQLDLVLNKLNEVLTGIKDSQCENSKSKPTSDEYSKALIESIGDVGDAVLNRIDEVYGNLIKPLVNIKNQVSPMEALIKANGDFVVGAVSQAIEDQSSKAIPLVETDNSEMDDLKSKLADATFNLKELRAKHKTLTENLRSLRSRRLDESKRYLAIRCSQLGLKESSVIRKLGDNLVDYSFDDIDEELRDLYDESTADQQSIEEPKDLNKINESRKMVVNASSQSESNSDLVSLIRNNKFS